jgi:hypothetical protein
VAFCKRGQLLFSSQNYLLKKKKNGELKKHIYLIKHLEKIIYFRDFLIKVFFLHEIVKYESVFFIGAAACFPLNILMKRVTPHIWATLVGLFCPRVQTPTILMNTNWKRVKELPTFTVLLEPEFTIKSNRSEIK